MTEEMDKPLLDPENFNREGIDLVSSPPNGGINYPKYILVIAISNLICTDISPSN